MLRWTTTALGRWGIVAAAGLAGPAAAQDAPLPVPTEPPAEPAAPVRGPVSPGFEDPPGSSDDEVPGRDDAGGDRKVRDRDGRGEDGGDDDREREARRSGGRTDPSLGRDERLIEQINWARGEIGLGELIDEILADVMAELDRFPPRRVSPMAIRQVSLGANVNPSFAQRLRNKIAAQIHAGTRVRLIRCLECEATRTRIEDGQWIITKGLVSTAELRAVGARLGLETFMDVAFGFAPELSVVEMSFEIIRAQDGQVVWAETFRADETTPMLYRSSEEPMKREDRLRDLEMLLEGRPYFGLVATAGIMLLPYDDPDEGDIFGATAGLRVYERFGTDRRVLFGLDLQGFFNPSRLAGGLLSAGLWWIPIRPDLINPELRIGGKAGAFLAGSEGNAAVFQLGGELLLRYRLGLYAYLLLMTESNFNGFQLGGAGTFGAAGGLSVNW